MATKRTILDVDAMGLCWEKAIVQDMGILPQLSGVLSVAPAYLSKQSKEDMTQLAFEQFNMSIFYTAATEICVVYASGRTSAVVVDLGSEESSIIKVNEG